MNQHRISAERCWLPCWCWWWAVVGGGGQCGSCGVGICFDSFCLILSGRCLGLVVLLIMQNNLGRIMIWWLMPSSNDSGDAIPVRRPSPKGGYNLRGQVCCAVPRKDAERKP